MKFLILILTGYFSYAALGADLIVKYRKNKVKSFVSIDNFKSKKKVKK